MKKINYLIILLLSLIINIVSVSAYSYSGAPAQAYIAYGSEIATILRDDDTTCADFLKEIDYDIYGTSGLTNNGNYIISLTGDGYVPGETIGFVYYNSYGSNIRISAASDDYIYMWTDGRTTSQRYTMSCTTGAITPYDESSTDLSGNSPTLFSILEKQEIGWRFYTRYFQSSFGEVYPDSVIGDYQFVGIYDSNGNQKMTSEEFIGDSYLDENLIVGNGVPFLPFREYLADVTYAEAPMTDEYGSIYISGDTRAMVMFNLIDENYLSKDSSIYIRPVANDWEKLIQKFNEAAFRPTFNFAFFDDYSDITDTRNYNMYYDTGMIDDNYFFKLDAGNYITSSKGGFTVLLTKYIGENKTFVIRYNKNVWSADFISNQSINNGSNMTVNTIDGEVTISNDSLNGNYSSLHEESDQIIDNGAGNNSGDSDFFDMLLSGVDGVTKFLDSVMSGIAALSDSIVAIVTACFTFLNSMPPEVSSVLYLCFFSGILAIILKVFL